MLAMHFCRHKLLTSFMLYYVCMHAKNVTTTLTDCLHATEYKICNTRQKEKLQWRLGWYYAVTATTKSWNCTSQYTTHMYVNVLNSFLWVNNSVLFVIEFWKYCLTASPINNIPLKRDRYAVLQCLHKITTHTPCVSVHFILILLGPRSSFLVQPIQLLGK